MVAEVFAIRRQTPRKRAIQSPSMARTTGKMQRKHWLAIGGFLAVAATAGLAMALHHPSPASPPAKPSAPDAQPALDPTFLVLASMGSTPPGARIVRVSDGFELGITPETVEFHQSNQPVLVRFELEGFNPVTREVPTDSDSEFRIALEPLPALRPHGVRSH
jgi:hypothetical protein